ncbi:hypothetical protein Taro_018181 [Colocasia esculenta]|uniref:Uncharacterized protein n=1 Tax=Colocasia esculenta TaxID=4460 RepID=A0A843UQ95_COLES|nr:hypothetical protein [Colocasia esculenta]
MENQRPPQAPTMTGRPWFRLTSMRASETPLATGTPAPVAEPPRPATPPPPATERPLLRLGSLLSRSTAPTSAVPPPPQEPPAQAPPPPQTQPPTPPPTVPTSGTPPQPPALPTPLATAALTQEQQSPSQALRSTPSSVVRPPSPPAPPAPQSLTVIGLPETTLRPPPPPSPTTTVSPPPPPPPPGRSTLTPPAPAVPSPRLPSPPVRTLSPKAPPATSQRLPSPPLRTLSPLAPPALSPRLPSPPPYPEPETKPVVSVVTSQSVRTQEPTSGLYKDRNNRINGNGGQKTQGGLLPSPTSTPKKADPAEPAAVPGKKKSGSSDEAESRMRVLTLAGENMGAYMNLGSGVHRGNTVKGHDRHLTQSQTATQSIEKVVVAPGSNGTGDASLDVQNYSAAKDVKESTGASKWKAGAASAKPMAALVNSNVQSVNNSIMFNSSCTQQSPGVYITLSSGSRRPSSSLAVAGDGNGNSDGKTGIGKDNARADH